MARFKDLVVWYWGFGGDFRDFPPRSDAMARFKDLVSAGFCLSEDRTSCLES